MRNLATMLFGLMVAGSGVSAADDHDTHQEADITEAPYQRDLSMTCVFSTECYEGEACADTDFKADLHGKAGGLSPDAMAAVARLESISGDVELLGIARASELSLVGGPMEARHMLTVSGPAARYSVHYLEGPMAITYLGRCQ